MNALYYPFHLCHEKTLHRLLADYQQVHFREYMALQLTPLMGTTAFPDRMGDYYPEFLKAGRIIQGHDVSGPMIPELVSAVNRDLADSRWRSFFHEALTGDYRFQRGLFDLSQIRLSGSSGGSGAAPLMKFTTSKWRDMPCSIETVRALSGKRLVGEEEFRHEYGFGLIKTAASLVYTIRLCQQLHLVAVTDSTSHHQLLARTCEREAIDLVNHYVKREGY